MIAESHPWLRFPPKFCEPGFDFVVAIRNQSDFWAAVLEVSVVDILVGAFLFSLNQFICMC